MEAKRLRMGSNSSAAITTNENAPVREAPRPPPIFAPRWVFTLADESMGDVDMAAVVMAHLVFPKDVDRVKDMIPREAFHAASHNLYQANNYLQCLWSHYQSLAELEEGSRNETRELKKVVKQMERERQALWEDRQVFAEKCAKADTDFAEERRRATDAELRVADLQAALSAKDAAIAVAKEAGRLERQGGAGNPLGRE